MSGTEPAARRPSQRPAAGSNDGSLYERYKDALRRGHVAALRGRDEAAIAAYDEATAIAPDRALPHASIAGILVRMGRLDEAVAAYGRALRLAPHDEAALRGLADVHLRTGRRTAAAAALDRLADGLDASGRLADATDAARRALEIAESRARRRQVEEFVGRLRASSIGDEVARQALDQALGLLEPRDRIDDRTDDTRADGPAGPITAASSDPGAAETAGVAGAPEATPETAGVADEPEASSETAAEVIQAAIALSATAEVALFSGDAVAARSGLLAAAQAFRRAGRMSAAVDACDLAIGLAPSDPDLHLLLVELYLDRGWRTLAVEKLLLLGRLADLDGDVAVRTRLCAMVADRLADEPRVADLCA